MSKGKVLEAAVEVFSEQGYYRASMDEIAERAGVAKGTLYYHFPGKAQLFQTLITEGFRMVSDRVKQQLDERLSQQEQIRRIVASHIDLYLQYSSLAKIFFNEISSGLDAEVLEALHAERAQFIDFVARLMAGADERDEAVDAERLTRSRLQAAGLLAMLDGLCSYYLQHPEGLQRSELDLVLQQAVSGMLLPEAAD